MQNDFKKTILSVAVLCIFILLAVGSVNTDSSSSSYSSSSSSSKWYEGGTLHRATMREWSSASYENQLATAADMVMVSLKRDGVNVRSVSFEKELRPKAVKLIIQMDIANRGGVADDRRVSEVAASILTISR